MIGHATSHSMPDSCMQLRPCVHEHSQQSSRMAKSARGTELTSLFGPTLLTAEGERPTADVLEGCEAVGIYFSAHWCPPCRRFTPEVGAHFLSTLSPIWNFCQGRSYGEHTTQGRSCDSRSLAADCIVLPHAALATQSAQASAHSGSRSRTHTSLSNLFSHTLSSVAHSRAVAHVVTLFLVHTHERCLGRSHHSLLACTKSCGHPGRSLRSCLRRATATTSHSPSTSGPCRGSPFLTAVRPRKISAASTAYVLPHPWPHRCSVRIASSMAASL
jgi:hypothetical protein